MKTQKIFSRILDVLILLVFILFFASAGFQDKSTSGWYQQFFPNMNGSSITSITFLDSLTGCAVTNTNSSLQGYILRTSNGGDNWNIVYTYTPVAGTISFNKIAFADANTGFATVNYYPFFKTTNAGLNWFIVSNTFSGATDMSVINKDTILLANSDIIGGGLFRSTNGGITFSPLGVIGGNGQPSTIYMYNKNMGFCLGGEMRKTTNGGVNWFAIPGETYSSIIFVDSLTGWKSWAGVKKTTNGGLNWFSQQLPNLPHSWVTSYVFALNKDTVWLVGDEDFNAPLYKTTNGGLNWGYQRADTSIHITVYDYIDFVTKKIGWAKSSYYDSNIHTTTGGSDTTYITGINNNVISVPKDFVLYQNYPNPFNNSTIINYRLSIKGEIKLIVYNIMGKEVSTLINKKQTAGTYDVLFNAGNLSSGVYFYSLFADGRIVDTKRALLIK